MKDQRYEIIRSQDATNKEQQAKLNKLVKIDEFEAMFKQLMTTSHKKSAT